MVCPDVRTGSVKARGSFKVCLISTTCLPRTSGSLPRSIKRKFLLQTTLYFTYVLQNTVNLFSTLYDVISVYNDYQTLKHDLANRPDNWEVKNL